MQLPNAVSISLGVVMVAALTAIAGALPGEMPGWTGLALAAVMGGLAKAVQVWMDSQQPLPEIPPDADMESVALSVEPTSAWHSWLVG